MSSYGRYDDFFTWGVPVGSRRFRSIYLTKTLITIASYGFLWPIPWLFYMRGSRVRVSSDIFCWDIVGCETFSGINQKRHCPLWDTFSFQTFAVFIKKTLSVMWYFQLSDFCSCLTLAVVRHLQLSDTCKYTFSIAFYIARISSSLNFKYQ